MLPDRVSNPGPLTYESGALPIALRGPALFIRITMSVHCIFQFVCVLLSLLVLRVDVGFDFLVSDHCPFYYTVLAPKQATNTLIQHL